MKKRFTILHMQPEDWRWSNHYASTLCRMGIPMGLQYSITAIGSVILQTSVNKLGSDAVAAVTAANRINVFMACPFDALGSTMATYGGQNVGAMKLKRVKDGLKSATFLGFCYSILAMVILFFFSRYLLLLFLSPSEVAIIGNARTFLLTQAYFYFPLAIVNIFRFMIQGMGYSSFAVLAGVMEMIARTVIALTLVPAVGFMGACFASPFAWILADLFLIPAFFYVHNRLQKKFQSDCRL